VIGKHQHSDGEHFHFVWGPGASKEASENEEVKAAYQTRGEELVPLGVHGTMVAVDWDACVADGAYTDLNSASKNSNDFYINLPKLPIARSGT
jgi:hypothetical protein